jgi:putative ABC transport system permease protein
MNLLRDISVAIQSLRANPLRAFLTLLGMAVGIAAVIYVVMLGEVARARIQESLDALGANVLDVRPGGSRMRGVSQAQSRESLTWEDAREVLATSRVIAEVVPAFSGSGQAEFRERNHQTRITGTLPTYAAVNKHVAALGRWFDDGDVARTERVAVLGSEVVEALFPTGNAVGEIISLNDIRFEIVGILETKGAGWSNPDDQIFIPLTTAQLRLFGVDHLTRMYAQVRDESSIQEAFFDIESVLRRNHQLRADQPNDFRIRKQDVFLATTQAANQEVASLILLIAMVSLVVGGIGIANVMLITVVERTREIGVRRAIGARRRDILGQFLVEAGVLAIVGGGIGVAGGLVLNHFALPPIANVPVEWIGYSLAICLSVGLASGLYPAVKAAHLDVIDAIRHE